MNAVQMKPISSEVDTASWTLIQSRVQYTIWYQ